MTFRLACTALLVLPVLAGCDAVDRAAADQFTRTGELIALSGGDAGAANACIACHGLDGRGNGAGTPRLAGLDAGYMTAQFDAYADGRRRHPEMHAIATKLAGDHRVAVSAYYAQMRFDPAPGADGAPDPLGARLYHRGDPARGLPSCASCHGAAGEGRGPANPPLGAQPAGYLAEQMERWRFSERRSDGGNVMQRISRMLTPDESQAVASYAARLPGGLPRPESPAASPAARRGDPRSGASAPPPHGAAPAAAR